MEGNDSDGEVETVRLTLTVARAEGIATVLETIAGASEGLTVHDVRSDGTTVPVDVGELTEKQRRTIVRAVELGYYATPRRASLETLSEEFDVSKSAVSQRLGKAESTIVRQIVEGLDVEQLPAAADDARDPTA